MADKTAVFIGHTIADARQLKKRMHQARPALLAGHRSLEVTAGQNLDGVTAHAVFVAGPDIDIARAISNLKIETP